MALVLITIPFSNRADAFYLTGMFGVGIAACLKIFFERGSRRFIGSIAVQFVVALLVAALLLRFIHADIWLGYLELFLKDAAFPLFLILVLLNNLRFSLSNKFPPVFRLLFNISLFGFIGFIGVSVLSFFSSISPDTSFYMFRHELGFYIVIFLVALNTLESRKDLKRFLLVLYFTGITVGVIAIAENVLYYIGGESIKNALIEHEFIREYFGHEVVPVRSQYPFEHHNRLGYYLLSVVFLTIAAGYTIADRKRRHWVNASALIPITGMFLTYTRGAVGAFFPAFFLLLILTRWRNLIWCVVIVLVLVLVTPAPVRKHYVSIFESKTYFQENSNAYTRLMAWKIAANIIRDYPYLGIGYGWKNFRWLNPYYLTIEDVQYSHCHNTYLEVGCETGVVGMVSILSAYFSLFAQLIIVVFTRVFEKTQRRIALSLCALFLATAIYMLTNYIFRYGAGMFIWFLFGLSLAFVHILFKKTPEETTHYLKE